MSALSSRGAGDTSFKVNGTPRGLPQRGRAPRTRSLSKAPANPRSRSRKEPGDMATTIWQSVVHAVFRRREHMATQAAKFDVTLPQAHLLRLLEHAPARNMGALADALSCDASNITGLVDRLEARGLITRGLAKERSTGEDHPDYTARLETRGRTYQTDVRTTRRATKIELRPAVRTKRSGRAGSDPCTGAPPFVARCPFKPNRGALAERAPPLPSTRPPRRP